VLIRLTFQRAKILINDGKFQEALNPTNKIWFRIKENGKENKLKENYRNTICDALQGLEIFDEAAPLNRENIRCYNNSIRIHIKAMRNAIHRKYLN
jgi:hypothetical protein